MLCCAALVLVLGVIREAWFRLPGVTRPAETGFAPVARRRAPGAASPAEPTPDRTTEAAIASSPGRLTTGLLVASLTTVGYVIAVYVLLLTGGAIAEHGSAVTWFVRDALFAAIALANAWAAVRRPHSSRPVPPREVQASALAGSGIALSVLGILDMHVFGLFEVGGGRLVGDLVFHGSGLALLLIGAAMLGALSSPRLRLRAVRSLERTAHS